MPHWRRDHGETEAWPSSATPVAATTGGRAEHSDVAVIICAYTEDRWETLKRGYEALLTQTRPPDGVIVVVDHNDLLLRRATDDFPLALVVANSGQRGLSGARNTGIAAVHSDLVLLDDDDDARPERDWLERLAGALVRAGAVGVGGWAVPDWDPPGRPSWFPEPFLWVVGCSHEGLPTTTARIRNPIGCTMGFRRSALVRAGGFSTAIGRVGKHPVACEETEFSVRVQRHGAGAHVVHEPSACVHHRVPPGRQTATYFLRRCFWEGSSKALVSAAVGSQYALASERSYAIRTLPTALVRRLVGAVRECSACRLQRSAALVVGLSTTTLGYVWGSVEVRRSRSCKQPVAAHSSAPECPVAIENGAPATGGVA